MRWFDGEIRAVGECKHQPKPAQATARPPARPFDPLFSSSVRLSVFYSILPTQRPARFTSTPCAQGNKGPRSVSVRHVGKGAGRCFGSHRRPTSASDRAGPCSAGARWLYRLHNSPSREPAGQRSARPFDEPKPPARERVLESPGNRTAAAAAAGPGRRARPHAEARRRRRRRPVCPGQGPRRGRGLEGARRPRAVRDPPHVPLQTQAPRHESWRRCLSAGFLLLSPRLRRRRSMRAASTLPLTPMRMANRGSRHMKRHLCCQPTPRG